MTASTGKDITVLVCSKDRALQLEAALRTFFACCADADRAVVHVLYATSGERHAQQYAALAQAFPQARFHPEIRFRDDVLRFARTGRYLLFAVDDAVFVRPFALADGVRALEEHPALLGFSYRLGRNIKKHYPTRTAQAEPECAPLTANLLRVDWTRSAQYFAYPLKVSSSLFRSADILPLLERQAFDHPNTLEAMLDGCKRAFAAARPQLAFYETSVAFCIPLNVVQNRFDNRHAAKTEWTAAALAERFAKGERLFPDGLSGFTPESCHQEVPADIRVPADGPAPSLPRDPFVSICIPTYDRERLLGEAVASALAQDYPNFEVVVVDDGSTDGTQAVLRAFADPRLCPVRQDNAGRPAARNRCVQEARGEYLLWLDSDDVLLPGVVRDAVHTLGQFPDADIVYGDLESVDADLLPLRVENYRDWYRNPEGLLAAMAFWNELPNPGTLVRRRCYDALGPYAADYPRAQDYEWFTRVPGRAEVKHLGRTVCKWRHHDNGRATTGRDLEYDCRIVEAMLAAHPLRALCPDLDWARLPQPVCAGLAALKFAERFAALGCLSRALAWVRKALVPQAGPQVNRLAKEHLELLSRDAAQTGQGKRARQAVLAAVATPRAAADGPRVLLVGEFFWPSLGGIEVFLGDLGAALTAQGFAVDVATKSDPDRKALEHDGMRIFEFPHYMDPDPSKAGGIADVATLVLRGGYDAVILLAHPAPLPFALLALPQPRPRILYLPIINRENLDGYLDGGFLPAVMQQLAKADKLLTITESSCDAQLIQAAGLPSRFVPHAVHDAPSPTPFRQTLGLADNVPLFVMVANYWPVKNHIGLIRVMRELPGEWKLHIIGNPHVKGYFQAVQQAAAGDPRIDVAGFTPREITAAAIRDADLLLLASKGEGCPMVILQAMRHGTPWLATPQCGSVRDQAGGVVVPLEHFPRVAATLVQENLLRKALGDLGKRHSRECFDIGRVAEAFADLIRGREVRHDFRFPEALRRKNSAVVQRVLQLSGLA
jgi:glycosyltransferase involved in cell wall biosynthesis